MLATRRFYLLYCIPLLLVLLCAGSARSLEQPKNVLYAGVMLSGGQGAEANYPIYQRNKLKLAQELTKTLRELSDKGSLPFTVVFFTDAQSRKREIANTVSLAIIVTRDDITTESYTTETAKVYKQIVNVGLDAVLYETAEIDGVQRNTVLYSFPLVGYSQSLTPALPTEADINTLFITTASSVLREHLTPKLQGVSLSQLHGQVASVSKDTCQIDIGATDGLDIGQNVKFLVEESVAFYGKVQTLDKRSASITYPAGQKPAVGMHVSAINMKGYSDNTFQVVEVKISSAKASQIFPERDYAPRFAHWFSSFLADRAGKIVMPSRVGGEWDISATGNAFKLIDKDGTEHRFELPPPKYPVYLDITGVSAKVAKSNQVNDVVLYKAWMKVTIPTIPYSQEFSDVDSKVAIQGMLQYEDNAVLYDLLYKLSEKISREAVL